MEKFHAWTDRGPGDLPDDVVSRDELLDNVEIFAFSERWLRTRFSDLRYYHAVDRSGHFAAFEQPELFVAEVRAALRALTG